MTDLARRRRSMAWPSDPPSKPTPINVTLRTARSVGVKVPGCKWRVDFGQLSPALFSALEDDLQKFGRGADTRGVPNQMISPARRIAPDRLSALESLFHKPGRFAQ